MWNLRLTLGNQLFHLQRFAMKLILKIVRGKTVKEYKMKVRYIMMPKILLQSLFLPYQNPSQLKTVDDRWHPTQWNFFYNLQAIHFLQRPKNFNSFGHYTSCVRIDSKKDEWLYYDGLRNMPKPPFLTRWSHVSKKRIDELDLYQTLIIYS